MELMIRIGKGNNTKSAGKSRHLIGVSVRDGSRKVEMALLRRAGKADFVVFFCSGNIIATSTAKIELVYKSRKLMIIIFLLCHYLLSNK